MGCLTFVNLKTIKIVFACFKRLKVGTKKCSYSVKITLGKLD